MAGCETDTPVNPDDLSYTFGMITFTGYADSLMTDMDVYLVDSYDYSPEPINISNSINTDCYPIWSYNKGHIFYISSGSNYSSIYRVDPATLDNYLILSLTERILLIENSPVSAEIAYLATITNETEYSLDIINSANLDTFHVAEIAQSANPLLAWSLDGAKLAVSGGLIIVFDSENGAYLYSINARPSYMAWDVAAEGLYVVSSGDLFHVDTLRQEVILTGYQLAYPSISPDRRYIAAVSQSRGNELIVIDLQFGSFDGVKQIALPQFECGDFRVADWAPDSRQLAFLDVDEGRWNIYTADEFYNFAVTVVTNDNSIKKSLCWK